MRRNTSPAWAVLYVLTLLILGLLLVVYRGPVAEGWQKVCAIAILLGYYGLVAHWLHRNRGALARTDQEQQQRRSTSRARDLALTPVQAHFLRVMEHHQKH